MISSPICAWPDCTARLISLALNSEPLGCTVILSLPPVAASTSLANCWMFSVWKLLAGYGVGMSQVVWACAAVAMPTPTRDAAMVLKRGCKNVMAGTPEIEEGKAPGALQAGGDHLR